VTENGDAVRMHLDGQRFDSLRTRLGGEVRFELPALVNHALTASLLATWNHELMGGAVTQNASFMGYSAAAFSMRTDVIGRDSLGLQAGVRYQAGQRLSVGAALSSSVYRAHDADLAGSVSAVWKF
jgi:subtilase-type serine protease